MTRPIRKRTAARRKKENKPLSVALQQTKKRNPNGLRFFFARQTPRRNPNAATDTALEIVVGVVAIEVAVGQPHVDFHIEIIVFLDHPSSAACLRGPIVSDVANRNV